MSKVRYLKRAGDPITRYHVWTPELAKRADMFDFCPADPTKNLAKEQEPIVEKPKYWAKHTSFGNFDILLGANETPIESIKGKKAAYAKVAELNGEEPEPVEDGDEEA
jgi:hypothetical protein